MERSFFGNTVVTVVPMVNPPYADWKRLPVGD
jgi:hypothetical protein